MAEDLTHARKPLIYGFIPRLTDKKVTIRLISGGQVIVALVYKLYWLTEEEIRIVEDKCV
jgi:hypothetical protein